MIEDLLDIWGTNLFENKTNKKKNISLFIFWLDFNLYILLQNKWLFNLFLENIKASTKFKFSNDSTMVILKNALVPKYNALGK